MKYFIVILAVLLSACQKAPESTKHVGDFQVQRLFEVDGCTVYRFYDDRTVYFTNCNNRATTTYQENCGKGCTRTMSN